MSILMLSAFMLLIITLFAGVAYIANHTVADLSDHNPHQPNQLKVPVTVSHSGR